MRQTSKALAQLTEQTVAKERIREEVIDKFVTKRQRQIEELEAKINKTDDYMSFTEIVREEWTKTMYKCTNITKGSPLEKLQGEDLV